MRYGAKPPCFHHLHRLLSLTIVSGFFYANQACQKTLEEPPQI